MHLITKPTKAELVRDTDGLGKMECYIRIKQGDKIYHGDISKVQGKLPVWNESYDLIPSGDGSVTLEVWDFDKGSKDDIVGDIHLNLIQLGKVGNNNSWFDLFHNGKVAGKIWIDIFTIPIGHGPVLLLTPIKAELSRDTDWVGKMDPFVKLTVNNNIFNTAVCWKGGKHPVWSDSYAVPMIGNGSGMIAVWELDGAIPELVGDANINLFTISQHGQLQLIELFYKGKKAGILHLQVMMLSK